MTMFVSWLVFPLVLAVLSLGCGLLLEHLAGFRILGVLLLPLGLSVMIVTTLIVTTNGATAKLATPLVIALAVAGFALLFPWSRGRVDRLAAAAAVGVFAVFGAPVLLSGEATFAGFIKLDDSALFLGLTDRLMEHGHNASGLAPSSYQFMVDYQWNHLGYPMGAFPPLGIGHKLLGTDSAWLFQPYVCFLAALLALGLYGLVTRLVESPRLRALTVFVASQPALLYGYALWGGVKEVASSALIVLMAALTPSALRERAPARSLLPLATASAALIGVLNLSSAAWLAPVLVPVLVAGLRLRGRAFARVAGAFAAAAVVLAVPSFLSAGPFLNQQFLNSKAGGGAQSLIDPLSWLQFFGVWPVGDFRDRPGNMTVTYILIGTVIAAGAAGLAWAYRRREWELPLYVVAASVGCAVAVREGSAWIGGKALATASPAFLVAAMAGVAWLFRSGRRVEAAVVAVAVAAGVGWSNALAYHDVWLAPRSQLAEQEQIGKRFAGDGPTLVTEWEFYGVRHFLRNMAPEGAREGILDPRPVPLRSGQLLPTDSYADIDEFQLDGILAYRTLVLGRSPAASRPPSVYRLLWRGRFYEVWQKPVTSGTRILEHLSLGQGTQAAAVPDCGAVLRLGREAEQAGGVLAAVVRPAATVLPLSQTSRPADWATYGDVAWPAGPGTLTAAVSLPEAGRYGVWIGGSFRRRLEIWLDGKRVGATRHRLSAIGVYWPIGEAELAAGSHELALRYTAANLSPGSGGHPFAMGPIILSRYTAELPVTYVQPAAASLCGKSLDWVEAVVR